MTLATILFLLLVQLFSYLAATHGHPKLTDPEKTIAAGTLGCPPPALSLRGVKVVARRKVADDYKSLGEVKFLAELPAPSPFPPERRLCKIKCVDGRWVGPLCLPDSGGSHTGVVNVDSKLLDDGAPPRFQPLLRSCRIERRPLHLVITYKNITITSSSDSFPHNSAVDARCREPLGLYKLSGEPQLTCRNGDWSSRLPSCIPTTILTNYTDDSPPTILVRLPSGSASSEPTGVLAVFPGSILHLECLFSRRVGNPEWTWTSPFRSYLTGWAIAPEERDWKYRLSIYYTKPQDSGVFTCATPRGLTNSLNVMIVDAQCERLDVKSLRTNHKHLRVEQDGTRLGQSVHFHCPTGFKLNGTANLTCRANGRWSGSVPTCEPIVCPRLEPDDPRLIITPHNNTYGSRVLFSCPWGYKLQGQPGIECHLDSTWSAPLPTCQPVRCPTPRVPNKGRLVEDENGGEYGVGSVVQFSCEPSHLLQGEGSIVCTDAGVWSHPPPLCLPVCDYPGEPENGRVIPLKFTYEPGDRLKVTCFDGFVTRLETKLICKSDGTWSQPLPECRNYTSV
ncbi:locomotion-related protein hikaru genki isoform X2 [Rhodnius prolixus]|uniref:locomotion-related protein hikaru genki isoform X2 n=1 Tax=Rhodnius prolixus TaxID=13249 RepID=UPI003D18D4B2